MKISVKTVLGITGIVSAVCVLAFTILYVASRINSRNEEGWKVSRNLPKANGDIYASEDGQKFITLYQDGLVYNYDGHTKTIRTGKINWHGEKNNKKSIPNKQRNPQPIKSDAISSEQTFTFGFEENLTTVIANDRMISFAEAADGKLDIRIQGYSGMTGAAKDFFDIVKNDFDKAAKWDCEHNHEKTAH